MVGMVFSCVTLDEMDPSEGGVYKRCSGKFQLVVHNASGSEGKKNFRMMQGDVRRCRAY